MELKEKEKKTFRIKARKKQFKQQFIYETLRMHLRTSKNIRKQIYIKAGELSIFLTGSILTVNKHIKKTNTIVLQTTAV